MNLPKLAKISTPMLSDDNVNYLIIKCAECGSVSVIKTSYTISCTSHSEPYLYYPCVEKLFADNNFSLEELPPVYREFIIWEETVNEDYDDCFPDSFYPEPPTPDKSTSIIENLRRYCRLIYKSLKQIITRPEIKIISQSKISHDCIDGICQDCINKHNINILFSTDNPINNYRRAYNKFNRRFSDGCIMTDYRWELQHLKNEISKELLCSISSEVYNSIILGSNPETPEDKENLAKKYVEFAKEDLLKYLQEYTRGRVVDIRSYIDSKKYLDSKADEAIEFLKKCDCKVYRCKKENNGRYSYGIRVNYCPPFPDVVVSDCKFYKIEERYNAEEALHKIIERKGVDMLENYQDNIAELLDSLPHIIAESDIWN